MVVPRGAWHSFLSGPVLPRMLTTPAQPKSSSHHFYPEPFEALSFYKSVLIQLLLHHSKPIPYRLNLPLWMYQDNRRSHEPKETDGNLLFQITATYILLLISILSLENRRSTSDTFTIAFISGESNCHKWKKKISELREFTGKVGAGVSLFEAGWLVWNAAFKEKYWAPPLGFSGAFMPDFIGEAPLLPFNSRFTNTHELSPMGDEEDHTKCPFTITQHPSSSNNNRLHGKATLHVSLQEVRQDSKAQSTSLCQRLL